MRKEDQSLKKREREKKKSKRISLYGRAKRLGERVCLLSLSRRGERERSVA